MMEPVGKSTWGLAFSPKETVLSLVQPTNEVMYITDIVKLE